MFTSQSEIHTAPWGSDISPYLGITEGKVRLAMMGNKMRVTTKNGIGSVYGIITAVEKEEDRHLIGQYGWLRTKDLSKDERKKLK